MGNYEGRNGPVVTQTGSPVLTAEEACVFLRLDSDHEVVGDQINSLNLLVRKRGLRPLCVGKARKYTEAELRRFVAAEVDRFAADEARPSDRETDGNGG